MLWRRDLQFSPIRVRQPELKLRRARLDPQHLAVPSVADHLLRRERRSIHRPAPPTAHDEEPHAPAEKSVRLLNRQRDRLASILAPFPRPCHGRRRIPHRAHCDQTHEQHRLHATPSFLVIPRRYAGFAPPSVADASVPPRPIVSTALDGTITIDPRSLIAS